MSRVHKYRAWVKKSANVEKEVMVPVIELEWDYKTGNNLLSVVGRSPYSLVHDWELKIEDVELMEFTGLLDKNGVEIYEGDIIKIESIVYYSDSSKKVYRNGKVIWNQNKSRFEVFLSKKHYNTFIWAVNEQSEVIGNIFENPEYLEE